MKVAKLSSLAPAALTPSRKLLKAELVGKPEGKRPLGRTRRRWEDNIKVDLQEVGCRSMDWIKLGQDRDRWRALVNEVMNLGFYNCGEFLD